MKELSITNEQAVVRGLRSGSSRDCSQYTRVLYDEVGSTLCIDLLCRTCSVVGPDVQSVSDTVAMPNSVVGTAQFVATAAPLQSGRGKLPETNYTNSLKPSPNSLHTELCILYVIPPHLFAASFFFHQRRVMSINRQKFIYTT